MSSAAKAGVVGNGGPALRSTASTSKANGSAAARSVEDCLAAALGRCTLLRSAIAGARGKCGGRDDDDDDDVVLMMIVLVFVCRRKHCPAPTIEVPVFLI